MPGSTPSRTTPRKAARDSRKSVRRCAYRRRVAGRSASEIDAVMTTAARVGCGRSARSDGERDEHQRDHAGADQPGELRAGSGLLRHGGARPARAHREALEQAGRDVGGADADHLPVAVDLHSLALGERGRGGDGVGEGDEGDAEGAEDAAGTGRSKPTVGMVNCGRPWSSGPTTATPRSASEKATLRMMATTTATRTAGTFGSSRPRTSMMARDSRPMAADASDDLAVDDALRRRRRPRR